MSNRICELFGIKYPVIQAGMVWCSGWRLASAVSEAGGLGLLGAGSMHPEVLQEHIQKMKKATSKPYGVNVPLMYPEIEKIMDIIIEEKVPIVFTSAGSPKKWTPTLQEHGIKVAHVVSSTFFAKKCEDAGVDAIVAEGFEAGGHNGREETASFPLLQKVTKEVSTPLLAAGGMYGGESLLAAQILGADGVQIGSRFAVCAESSSHELFKKEVIKTDEGETLLVLKKLAPTRLIKNAFFEKVFEMENKGGVKEELQELLGKGRAKKGIFEGDLEEGELEIGQIASKLDKVETVQEIMDDIISTYNKALDNVKKYHKL
ncbi:enoyl-[acyl-carrier protein] reductase II [Balneicella halophila]|uniref:Enoyl-[acyl-carrier protein] reductase II n=1 Tax=Balneicella halophila TaxID=1537566 RepID=A0A7L4UQE5_BALHA|nr:nitronate monooxygenase [Balneicella halophila]PVX51986.1 enoyl-[acyl-carrier protein] reductase II [Balneicella halophila]